MFILSSCSHFTDYVTREVRVRVKEKIDKKTRTGRNDPHSETERHIIMKRNMSDSTETGNSRGRRRDEVDVTDLIIMSSDENIYVKTYKKSQSKY